MNFSRFPLSQQPSVEVLGLPHLIALRPRQWTKNLVVFAAPLFAFSIHPASLWEATLAFVLFCFVSSGFYLINDILDIQADRQHPVKCKRPIAAGQITLSGAWLMALALLGGAIALALFAAPLLGGMLLAYAVLQFAYNLRLKRMPILDIMAIALGFVLRACGGAAATGLPMSPWFLLCTGMLALFLGVEKRKAELRFLELYGGRTRAVLKQYSLSLLTRMENIVTTAALMSYALWSSGPIVGGASTQWMMVTFPFVLYGIFRYQFLSDPGQVFDNTHNIPAKHTERPEEILLTDLPTLLTVVGWVVTVFLIFWLKSQGLIQ